MRTEHEEFVDEMTALNRQREAPKPKSVLEPTTAKYLLDFLYLTRDDEQFRFYKKVSHKFNQILDSEHFLNSTSHRS